MALQSPEMIDILDRYGLTGTPQETEYPTGTDGWDSHTIPWGHVLDPRRDLGSDAPFETQVPGVGSGGSWQRVGQEIWEAAERNQHLPPPADVDALAWYLPFHYFGLDWGIYVKEASIFEIAATIHLQLGRPPLTKRLSDDLCRMALTVLYLHEAFHHKVESFATRLEMASLHPHYRQYKDNVVGAVRGTNSHLEEAVACAEMLTRLDEVAYKRGVEARTLAATKSFVRSWIPQLPPGYNQALHHLGDSSKWSLQAQVNEGTFSPVRSPADWALADNMLRGFFDKDDIAHVIVPVGQVPIIPWLYPLDPLVSVSTDRLVRHLKRDFGYVEVAGRGKGGHRWFECSKPGFAPFPLPGNRESLSPGVLRTVVKALGYKNIRDLAAHC